MIVKHATRSYRSELRAVAAEETHARIVEAARALLAGGRDAPPFSLDAVARAAGVTRLTVYNQFESKRGLLEAVFDDMARQGGLLELPSAFAEPDSARAMIRFVSVFCRFWAAHAKVLPRFSAVARLDDEFADGLKQRTERRRHALTMLVQRLAPDRDPKDLVDVLFALTSFEMFDLLSVRRRGAAAVEALLQQLVNDALRAFRAPPRKRRN